MTESANATVLIGQTPITDSNSDDWSGSGYSHTGVGYFILKDSVKASTSTYAVELYYSSSTIYARDNTNAWWSWNGSSFVSSSNPGTYSATLVIPTPITDANGDDWSLGGYSHTGAGYFIMKDSVKASTSDFGVELYYFDHTIYARDNHENWYTWGGSSFSSTTDPRTPTSLTSTSQTNTAITVSYDFPSVTQTMDYGSFQLYYKLHTSGTWTSGPSVSYCTPGNGNFTDAYSNTWAITSGGVVTVNTYNAGYSASVTKLLLVNGEVWQEAASLWYGYTPAGSITSGIASGIIWNPGSGTSVSPLSAFTITGLTSATSYDFEVTMSDTTGTSDPTSTLTQSTASAGPGPTASGDVTVDFSTQVTVGGNAQTVSQYVWGVSTSSLGDSNFAGMANASVQSAFSPLAYPLMRFNTGGSMDALYPSGATSCTSAAKATAYGNLINNWNSVLPTGCRIIIGLSANPDSNWSSAANFAAACSDLVTWFNTTNGTGTGAPMPIYGFEIGNENNLNPGYPTWYSSYFNAAKTAIKTVNSSWKMFGPTFSWADSISSFGAGTTNNCDVLDYHAYRVGPTNQPGDPGYVSAQTNWTNDGGESAMLSATILSSIATDYSNYTGGGGTASELFIGEYNDNNTWGTATGTAAPGGPEPGALNTYQQNAAMPVFAANTILSGLNSTTVFTMAGIWSAWEDSDYGIVGGTDNVNGAGPGYTVSPCGYFLSRAAACMYGPRYTINMGTQPATLTALAVAGGPGATNLGVLLINASTSTDVTGIQVALSKWPVNSTGDGTVTKLEISAANPTGSSSSVTVTAGKTSAITVPACSVVFLYA